MALMEKDLKLSREHLVMIVSGDLLMPVILMEMEFRTWCSDALTVALEKG
jgi:hypothetical protein